MKRGFGAFLKWAKYVKYTPGMEPVGKQCQTWAKYVKRLKMEFFNAILPWAKYFKRRLWDETRW